MINEQITKEQQIFDELKTDYPVNRELFILQELNYHTCDYKVVSIEVDMISVVEGEDNFIPMVSLRYKNNSTWGNKPYMVTTKQYCDKNFFKTKEEANKKHKIFLEEYMIYLNSQIKKTQEEINNL